MNYNIPPSHIQTLPESVILVDEQDRAVGVIDKLAAHEQALLHRAFSIFIFRMRNSKLELLLQQRALTKYHSGGLWTNSCCGHPRYNEMTSDAAARRLYEEMGLRTPLHFIDTFIYKANVTDGLIEHEYDHIYYGIVQTDVDFTVNVHEVANIKWLDIASLTADYIANPGYYTAWFKHALDTLSAHLPNMIFTLQQIQDGHDA